MFKFTRRTLRILTQTMLIVMVCALVIPHVHDKLAVNDFDCSLCHTSIDKPSAPITLSIIASLVFYLFIMYSVGLKPSIVPFFSPLLRAPPTTHKLIHYTNH